MVTASHLDDAVVAVANTHSITLDALEEVAMRTQRELAEFRRQLRFDPEETVTSELSSPDHSLVVR